MWRPPGRRIALLQLLAACQSSAHRCWVLNTADASHGSGAPNLAAPGGLLATGHPMTSDPPCPLPPAPCSYFYIPARKEHRGIGGLFFDDLSSEEVRWGSVGQAQRVLVLQPAARRGAAGCTGRRAPVAPRPRATSGGADQRPARPSSQAGAPAPLAPPARPRPPPAPVAPSQVSYDVPAFVREVGDGILPSWTNIAKRRRELPVSPEQRDWQLLRRGRCAGGWAAAGLPAAARRAPCGAAGPCWLQPGPHAHAG
jgi:hypothetical protein